MDIWLFTNECIVFCIAFVSHTRLDLIDFALRLTIATAKQSCVCTEIYSYENAQKLLPPEVLLLAQICTKSFIVWGFAPDPNGGAYSPPQTP